MQGEELLRALGRLAKEQDQAVGSDDAQVGVVVGSGTDLGPASPERIDALTATCLGALKGAPVPSQAVRREARDTRRRLGAPTPLGKWTATRSGRAVLALGGAAASSLVVLLLWLPSDKLPAYGIEVAERSGEVRGAPVAAEEVKEAQQAQEPKPLVITSGASLEVVLRPQIAHTKPVTARIFFRSPGGESLWSASIEVASSGAIRAVGKAPGPAGPPAAMAPDLDREIVGELVALVASPQRLPLSTTEVKGDDGVVVLRRAVVWR